MSIRFDALTDDLQIVEGEFDEPLTQKFVMEPIDYLHLILGARDYDYLLFKNKNILDNEVSSLYPVTSYPMLMFILFMLSFKNPVVAHLFQFRKDREFGVYSSHFNSIIQGLESQYPAPSPDRYFRRTGREFRYPAKAVDGQDLVYNFSSRPFHFLSLPRFKILSSLIPFTPGEKGVLNELYRNPGMLTWRSYPPKLKVKMQDVERIFKAEVLLFLPRYYYNMYSRDREIKSRAYHTQNPNTRTDLERIYLRVDLGEEAAARVHANIKTFFGKIGLNPEIPSPLELIRRTREEPVESVDLLHEFFLKSILVRRHPSAPLNTRANRTNGVYLLHRGASRWKELVTMEILNNPKIMSNRSRLYKNRSYLPAYNIMDYVKVTDRAVVLHYGKNEQKRLRLGDIVDWNNKPFLLSERFMAMVDSIYGRYEIHSLLKYAQVYLRLFNQLAANSGDTNHVIWFVLGNELSQHTGFSYPKFMERVQNHKRPGFRVRANDFTFKRFEEMFYRRKGVWYDRKPDYIAYKKTLDMFLRMGLYTPQRHEYFKKKFGL